jgi:hypothetical protein
VEKKADGTEETKMYENTEECGVQHAAGAIEAKQELNKEFKVPEDTFTFKELLGKARKPQRKLLPSSRHRLPLCGEEDGWNRRDQAL